MNLDGNYNNQSPKPIVLHGLNNNASFQSVSNNLPQQSNVSNLSVSDTIRLHGLNTGKVNGNNFSSVSFNLIKTTGDVDALIAEINANPDINERSSQLRDLFVILMDNDDFTNAVKAINASPTLIYKNAMFKSLVQELVSAGEYDTAISITNKYPDARVQAELKEFISSYLNNYANDSTKAAQAQGNDSFFNVALLKTQSILGSVGNFFSGIGSSVTSIWSSPTRASSLASSANNTVGKMYRYAFLDGGNLACAYAVSQMLKGVPGLEGIGSAECNTLAGQLSKNGFVKINTRNYQPGDVVFFNRTGKSGYGHVGVVAEVKNGIPYMVHNSSQKRAVVKVRLDQYYKTPVAVYRPA